MSLLFLKKIVILTVDSSKMILVDIVLELLLHVNKHDDLIGLIKKEIKLIRFNNLTNK